MKPILASEELCTGCAACYAACSVGAISMDSDTDGFLRPVTDHVKCVECGKCEKACPILCQNGKGNVLACYAVKARNSVSQYKSASGGLFFELAARVISAGGCVYGCAYDEHLKARHIKACTMPELEALRDSKYVQSDQATALLDAIRDLKEGRLVLYSGTSCQIAGLTAIVGRECQNLLCVELICHGVPSPALFEKFKREKELSVGDKLVGLSFKSKTHSWLRHHLRLAFSSGKVQESPYGEEPYVRAFEGRYGNRPSCHNCQTREGVSGADLTIGDYWGVEDIHPDFCSDYGVSVAIVRTSKGLDALQCAELDLRSTEYSEILPKNPDVERREPLSLYRHKRFYKLIRKCSISKAVDAVRRRPLWRRVVAKMIRMLGIGVNNR